MITYRDGVVDLIDALALQAVRGTRDKEAASRVLKVVLEGALSLDRFGLKHQDAPLICRAILRTALARDPGRKLNEPPPDRHAPERIGCILPRAIHALRNAPHKSKSSSWKRQA